MLNLLYKTYKPRNLSKYCLESYLFYNLFKQAAKTSPGVGARPRAQELVVRAAQYHIYIRLIYI